MYFSKTMIARFIMVACVVIVLWSLWKRIDAIIDNYQKYYDVALIQKIWTEEEKKFSEKFDAAWKNFDPVKGELGALKEKDKIIGNETDKKWEEYQKKAPFPAENKPVPMVADEYTKGYYQGLWNFFITSGFASIFAALFLAGSGFFIIRWLWRKIDDELIEKILSKRL